MSFSGHIILTNLYQQEQEGQANKRRMSKLLKEQISSLQEMRLAFARLWTPTGEKT